MEVKTFTFLKHKSYLFSFFALMLASILYSTQAFSQVDYYYGLNKKGFRFGLGAGASIMNAHYEKNPPGIVAVGTLEYAFSQYVSLGIEGQYGPMKGEDPNAKQYYSTMTDTYSAVNFNLKVSIGAFNDYETLTELQDAIKRIYIGVGVGVINPEIKFGKQNPNASQMPPGFKGSLNTIPISFGTNINLHGFLGRDKVELNPNYQYSYINSTFLDGVGPSKYTKSNSSGYSLLSLSLKYKF